MDEGRLLYVRRVTKMRHKLCAAVNDKIKDKLRVLTDSLEKNKKSKAFRSWQSSVGLKWSFTKSQSLQKCLREDAVCENELESPRTYGRYDGTRLTSYKRQMDDDIAYNHPKERRKRKIEEIKNDREKYGMFHDYSKVREKLESILERPPKYQIELDKVVRKERRRPVIRRRQTVNQRAQLRLPPITVSRDTYTNKQAVVQSFPVDANPLPSIQPSFHVDANPLPTIQPSFPVDANPLPSIQPSFPVDANPLPTIQPSFHVDANPLPSIQPSFPVDANPLPTIQPSFHVDANPLPTIQPSFPVDANPLPTIQPSFHVDANPLPTIQPSFHVDVNPLSSIQPSRSSTLMSF